jgi:hypothetical protein
VAEDRSEDDSASCSELLETTSQNGTKELYDYERVVNESAISRLIFFWSETPFVNQKMPIWTPSRKWNAIEAILNHAGLAQAMGCLGKDI